MSQMKKNGNAKKESLLASVKPSKAIVNLAVPATLALLAKAVYNIVDTAYIGMLNSDIALAAVGVTLPLLLIMVSIENIFAAGAGVLAGRQLGENEKEEANRTVTTMVGFSMIVGIALCIIGLILMEPLLRAFGASDAVLPQAKEYAFWMFIAALFNLPAQSMNCAARAESSVKISSFAVISGAALNVILDPIFMFSWGLDMGVEGASLATTISQCVTFVILLIFYMGGFSIIKIRRKYFKLSAALIWNVVSIGIPTAVIQICLAVATSLTNIAAKTLPDSDLIIAAYGVVQRLVLIGCYVVMGFMQGYQPVASYAFGARDQERFRQSAKFAFQGAVLLTVVVAVIYIVLARPLILLFNRNPLVVEYGKWLLISQVLLYPAFGICYMMTITFQTIGASRIGLFLSLVRQCLFYVPFIMILPGMMGVKGIYISQPAADALTLVVCVILVKPMKERIIKKMKNEEEKDAERRENKAHL